MCQYLDDAETRFWRIFGFAAMASSPSFLFFVVAGDLTAHFDLDPTEKEAITSSVARGHLPLGLWTSALCPRACRRRLLLREMTGTSWTGPCRGGDCLRQNASDHPVCARGFASYGPQASSRVAWECSSNRW
jgi:hypothetical protein